MNYKIVLRILISSGLYILNSCTQNNKTPRVISPRPDAVPFINYSVTKTLPHDTSLFIEGFLMHNGQLFESTGSPDDLPQTRSMIGTTDLATGRFEKKIEIDRTKYFGEGIVFLKKKLYQLTYTNQVGFIYDANSFKLTGKFAYKNIEGWSLTTDGINLIMSDGTNVITFLDPEKFRAVKTITVTENKIPRDSLNEMEYIKEYIYANIWQSNIILKIDPATGNVVGKIDLGSLKYEANQKNPKADVLNGIAYDSLNDKIYVTGKLWANIYQINFPH
ncbi:MAG: glutaminyl-peptide cyclotransferase [Ferruginibacter sp.]